jgi:hypothetical protein
MRASCLHAPAVRPFFAGPWSRRQNHRCRGPGWTAFIVTEFGVHTKDKSPNNPE